MRHIFTHDNIMVLNSAKNILALNGIESFVKNEHTVPIGANHGINNTFLELWILDDQEYDKASAIIENEIENPVPGDSWICDTCSEENDSSFEVCWKCQGAAPQASQQ
jgi:hypothetical protein